MKLIKGILAVPLVITGYVMLAGGLVLGLAAAVIPAVLVVWFLHLGVLGALLVAGWIFLLLWTYDRLGGWPGIRYYLENLRPS